MNKSGERIIGLRIALNDIIALDHHWHGPEGRATEIARAALIRDDDIAAHVGPCQRCHGTGETVTDWDRYLHPQSGDAGDAAVTECSECNGSGHAALRAGK